jgi:hypothetical protein
MIQKKDVGILRKYVLVDIKEDDR